MRTVWTAAGLLLLSAVCAGGQPTPRPPVAAEPDAAKLDFFEKKVRPILVGHCHACHAAETKPAGGLRVDDRKGLLTGGNGGPAVVPGKPADSPLVKRVQKDARRRMPAEGEHLTDDQIAVLSKWIEDGAVWPPVAVPASVGKDKPKYEQLRKEHWAFQPVKANHDRKGGGADVIDELIRVKLAAAGLKPVAAADRLTLVRRLTFDLTGLPPTPVEIDTFLADDTPDAVARLADRLLASPAFGEHWGRHWLDVARYGESTGPSRNIPYPHATLLALMGLDHEKLTYSYAGRDFRLTDVKGEVVKDIFA